MRKLKPALRLRTINLFFLVSIVFLCVVLIAGSILLSLQFQSYASSSDQYVRVTRSALNLKESSEYLTEQSRLFVLSTDASHLKNYFEELNNKQRRENSITYLKEYVANETSIQYLEAALNESYTLANLEYYAMKLVILAKHYDQDSAISIPRQIMETKISDEDMELSDQYKISRAWLMLFSQDYISKKHEINELESKAISEIFNYSEDTHLYNFTKLKIISFHMMGAITAIFVIVILFSIGVFLLVINPIYSFIKSIEKEEKFSPTRTKEFNILQVTYNTMFDKNQADEVLLRHKAEHDELTGLINRTAYNQITQALNSCDESIAFILADIDKFKEINDHYGHATGDEVLKKVSKALTENFRTTDYVCRIGGDEFAIILTQCDKNQENTKALIKEKTERIKNSLLKSEGTIPSVTLSLGVALSSCGLKQDMYEQADQALYNVKRNGRNNIQFF